MFFSGSKPNPGSHFAFGCYVSAVSFNLESFVIVFYDLDIFEEC